jgi:hypothetical protein
MAADPEQQRLRRDAEATFTAAWDTQAARHGVPTCAICSAQDWFFYTALMLPIGYFGQTIDAKPDRAYVAQFACRRCGYLLYFDAFSLVGDSLDP